MKSGEAYDVAERLSQGPGAVVYRATQTATGRDVLFKVLRGPGFSDHALDTQPLPELLERLSHLQHPHIAEWLDAYEDPDGFVLVHEFLAGTSGGVFPTKQTLSAVEARTLARQLCQALQAGEQTGIPHGDLKPNNLLIASHEREGVFVKVLDWGLSLCRDEPTQESLFFMAPEVLQGAPPSPQSDLFSAAATLCYLLTGCVPVQGATRQELLDGWPRFDVMVLKELRPDLDQHFLKWLGWLLQLDPANRPASVAKALEVLWQVIAYANAGKPEAQPAKSSATPSVTVTPAPPSGPRRAGPQRPSPAARPIPSEPVSAPVEAAPTKPRNGGGLRKVALFGTFVAVLLGVTCAWLRLDWGPGWTEELGRRWEQWSFENLPNFKWKTSESAEPESRTISASVEVTPAESPAPIPSPPKPTPPPTLAAIDPLEYPSGSKLDGAQGGTGWASPWKASNVGISRSGDGKYVFATFGGGKDSTAQRDAGSLGKLLLKGSTNLYFTINHPGRDAPPLKVNIAGVKEGDAEAPLVITPEGDKLHVSIEGSPDIMDAPAGKTLRFVMRWDFKKQRSGKYDVEIRAFLNPNPKSKSPLSGCASSRRVLKNVTPPASLIVMLEANGGNRPLTVGDVNVSGQILDIIK